MSFLDAKVICPLRGLYLPVFCIFSIIKNTANRARHLSSVRMVRYASSYVDERSLISSCLFECNRSEKRKITATNYSRPSMKNESNILFLPN